MCVIYRCAVPLFARSIIINCMPFTSCFSCSPNRSLKGTVCRTAEPPKSKVKCADCVIVGNNILPFAKFAARRAFKCEAKLSIMSKWITFERLHTASTFDCDRSVVRCLCDNSCRRAIYPEFACRFDVIERSLDGAMITSVFRVERSKIALSGNFQSFDSRSASILFARSGLLIDVSLLLFRQPISEPIQ